MILIQYLKEINLSLKRYWGWGGEDDDFFKRVKSKNLTINYLDSTIGRFKVRIIPIFISIKY